MTESLRISIIIATYRREEVLCATLSQVLSEPYANKEVLVIDQTEKHTSETLKYLESVKHFIRYIHMDHPSVVEAENLGIREATGDVVLFLDDDVSFEAGLIERHARNYADASVSGVTGLVLERGHSVVRRLSDVCWNTRFGYFFFRHDYAGRVRVSNVAEGNTSFRRRVLLDAGLFDERFRENAYLFGMDLAVRVARAGEKIVHDPKAGVLHLRAPTGGVRMKRVRPASYYRNLFYFLNKHMGRHERFAVAVRVFFYRVLAEGWRRPWTIPWKIRPFVKGWWVDRVTGERGRHRQGPEPVGRQNP
jgi:GT2 family glycosyltransferase